MRESSSCGRPTGEHEPDPYDESRQTAVGGDLDGSGMEVADHVGKRAVCAHLKLVWMPLHAGESYAEKRVRANDMARVSPDEQTVLSAGIGKIKPTETAARMEPGRSDQQRYCH